MSLQPLDLAGLPGLAHRASHFALWFLSHVLPVPWNLARTLPLSPLASPPLHGGGGAGGGGLIPPSVLGSLTYGPGARPPLRAASALEGPAPSPWCLPWGAPPAQGARPPTRHDPLGLSGSACARSPFRPSPLAAARADPSPVEPGGASGGWRSSQRGLPSFWLTPAAQRGRCPCRPRPGPPEASVALLGACGQRTGRWRHALKSLHWPLGEGPTSGRRGSRPVSK